MKFILFIFLISISAFCQETQVNTSSSYADCKDMSIRDGLSSASSIDKEFDIDINGPTSLVYIHHGLITTDSSFLGAAADGEIKSFCYFIASNPNFPNNPLVKVHFSNVKITSDNVSKQLILKTEQNTYPLFCHHEIRIDKGFNSLVNHPINLDASVSYLAESIGSVATLRCNERIDVTGSVSPKQNADSVKKVPANNKKPGKTKTTNSTQKAS